MKVRAVTSVTSVLFIALMSSTAYADGTVSLKDTPVAVAPTWAGPYFGMSIGYGHNDSTNDYSDSADVRSSKDESADGGLVSLIWGVDCMLRDRVVVGGFVDFDWSDINRGHDDNALTIDRSFQIGGRIGYLVTERTMLFASAGYSRAHFDNEGWWDIDPDGGGPTQPGNDSKWFNGYFLGAGFESRIGGNFFLRGEARYADYSSEHSNVGSFAGVDWVDSEDPEIWTGRLGITYKLGRNEGNPFYRGEAVGDSNIKVITYNGFDVAKDIWTFYGGSLFALNGDFDRNGFVARAFGYYSDYTFSDTSTEFDGKDRALDVMLGYMHYFGNVSATGYIGMEVRDIDNDPADPTSDLEGTQTGFKVAAEIETGYESPWYFDTEGSYSTAFNSYYGLLRTGYNMKRAIFGPEGEIYSDEGEVTWRLGGFVTVPFNLTPTMPSEVSFSAGHQFVEDNDDETADGSATGVRGGEGAYFNTYLKIMF